MKNSFQTGVRVLFWSLAVPVLASGQLMADDWPQWRGPDRTGVSKETGLKVTWTGGEPKRVWLFENAGIGYSGPAVANAKLFTMGARNNVEVLLALDALTGKELWVATLGPVHNTDHGKGPRGTPTVDGDHVYALGSEGKLVCARASDGSVAWRHSLQEFGGKPPNWGYSESVLVDGGQVVCTPGGRQGAVVALDKRTGELLWQSKEFTDGAQYSSIVTVDLNGTRQYIQRSTQKVAGISAKDGKLLWTTSFPGRVAVIPTPVYRDGYVYVSAGYSAGCKAIKIGPGNEITEVYANRVMKNHHGGVVLIGDHLYGYSDGVGWLCQNFKSGEEVWSEKRKFGKGAVTAAGGMLYCLEEDSGELALVEASPRGWREHGRLQLNPKSALRDPQGRIWTHPVISNGKLYLRDQEFISCYDAGAKQLTSVSR